MSRPSATSILSRAQSMPPKDATFTLNYTITDAANHAQFSGNGELSSNPPYSHRTIAGTIVGQNIITEEIADDVAKYTKTIVPNMPSDGKWQKTELDSFDPFMRLSFSSLYSGIKHPKLVGTGMLNGNRTYHITGTFTGEILTAIMPDAVNALSATEDIWIRTDNFYPAKFNITRSSVSSLVSTTSIVITFIKWDSGIAIAIPSPEQVGNSR